MKTVILYKSDLDDSGLGIGWDGLLDAVGIDTHSVVNGKIVSNDVEEIEIVVHSATITDRDDWGNSVKRVNNGS